MFGSPAVRLTLLATTAASALALTACGGGLSEASTCSDFMQASTAAQDAVVRDLAVKFNKPDYITPLGRPAVPYACVSRPNVTLGELFASAD